MFQCLFAFSIAPSFFLTISEVTPAAAVNDSPVVDTAIVAQLDSANLASCPLLDISNALALQTGALEYWPNADRGWTLAFTDETIGGPDFSVLGHPPFQVSYSLNGAVIEDPGLGILTATASLGALEHTTFWPWHVPASNSAAGLMNVSADTRHGSSDFHGGIESASDNIGGNGFDQNYYRGWLDGPIPLVNEGSFSGFTERRWLGDRRPSPIASEVTADGSVCLPANSLSGWSYHGRASYDITQHSTVSAHGDYSKDEWQEYRHSWLLNSAHAPRYEDKFLSLGGEFDHSFTNHSRARLNLSCVATERWRGDGVVFKDYLANRRPHDNPESEEQGLFWTPSEDLTIDVDSVVVENDEIIGGYSRGLFFNRNEADLFDVDTLSSPGDTIVTAEFLDRPAYFEDFLHRKTQVLELAGQIRHRVNENHNIRAGFEGRRFTARQFRSLDATSLYSEGQLTAYGFDSLGNEADTGNWQRETKHPLFGAFYAEDKMEFGKLQITAGARIEYFDYDARMLVNQRSPFDPNESLQDANPNNDDPDDTVLDEGDMEKAETYLRYSPRFSIQYKPNSTMVFQGSFGVYRETPPLDLLYIDWKFFEERISSGAFYPFPSSSLEPVRTDKWLAGWSGQLSDQTLVTTNLFYNKTTKLPALFHESPAFPYPYDYYQNWGTLESRGVEFGVELRPHHDVSFAASLVLFEADFLERNSWTTSHKFVATAGYTTGKNGGPALGGIHPFESLRLSLVFRQWSGRSYSGSFSPDDIFIPQSSYYFDLFPTEEQTDALNTFDLKLERRFTLVRQFSLSAFVLVKNLTDNKNVSAVYRHTGEPYTTGWLETPAGESWTQQFGDEFYRLKENDPMNYAPPRQVYFGLGARF